ncbi:MAG TPA: flagellar basal body-associated FliL family protein [Myxococcota bacterium]
MSDPAPDHAAPAPAKSGGLSGKLVLAVAGINLLATTGLAAVVVLRGNPAAPPAAHAEEGGEHGDKKAEGGEHGEKKAEGHGEEKPAAEGHGEEKPAAEGHGEEKPAEGGHGEAAKPAEGGEHGAAPAAAGATPAGMNTARLEDIVVHLRNPEVDRYARLTLDVEMSNAEEVKALQDNVPRVRDAVIMTLSEHTFEELRGAEGLTRMKGWLRNAIDDVVPGRVSAVYISTFLVQ